MIKNIITVGTALALLSTFTSASASEFSKNEINMNFTKIDNW